MVLPSRSRALLLWVHRHRVGTLTSVRRGEHGLQYDPEWTSPAGCPLSPSLPAHAVVWRDVNLADLGERGESVFDVQGQDVYGRSGTDQSLTAQRYPATALQQHGGQMH